MNKQSWKSFKSKEYLKKKTKFIALTVFDDDVQKNPENE